MHKRIYEDKSKVKRFDTSTRFIIAQSERYLAPYSSSLYLIMDVRLVRTFFDVFLGILAHRNKDKGLILSELGGYILGFTHAVSGTKRLSNLFLSSRWGAALIEKIHLHRASGQVQDWTESGHRVLGFVDDSTLEKPESWLSEGLSAVYSSRAARLTRIKPGYYKQPAGRICVPGYNWTGLVLGGIGLIPMLGMMKFWSKRGLDADSQDNVFYKLIKQIHHTFGNKLTLVLDRGFANLTTLDVLFKWEQFFIIRWKSAYLLTNKAGETKNTWRICHGKKGLDQRVVGDKERKKFFKVEIVYAPVTHPEYGDKNLTLVVVRNKSVKNQQPMYILTNTEVDSIGMAWDVFKSYIKRWDIEQAFRFCKAELGIQSIRVHKFQTRLKIMAILTLVFDFLLQLSRNRKEIALLIMKKWAPRTDKRMDDAESPIYRLRLAMTCALLQVIVDMAKLE